MSQRTFHTFSKEPTRRQIKQLAPKGCCCKRSQCIKNYCDCYQSMTTCSAYCKCVGCRNTEERLALVTPPKKSAIVVKRERAAALSAKAAAAAAKAGINIHLKPAPGSAAFNGQQLPVHVPQQSQILQLPDANLDNIITLPPPNATALAKKPQPQLITSQTALPPKDVNLFKQPINAALLECMMAQAVEAEKLGMDEVQVGKLVLHEFARGLQAISKAYSV